MQLLVSGMPIKKICKPYGIQVVTTLRHGTYKFWNFEFKIQHSLRDQFLVPNEGFRETSDQ